MLVLFKLIFRVNVILVIILVVDGGGWLVRVDMLILNFIWKMKGLRMVKSFLRKN